MKYNGWTSFVSQFKQTSCRKNTGETIGEIWTWLNFSYMRTKEFSLIFRCDNVIVVIRLKHIELLILHHFNLKEMTTSYGSILFFYFFYFFHLFITFGPLRNIYHQIYHYLIKIYSSFWEAYVSQTILLLVSKTLLRVYQKGRLWSMGSWALRFWVLIIEENFTWTNQIPSCFPPGMGSSFWSCLVHGKNIQFLKLCDLFCLWKTW